jgi:hypothetical protein
LPEDFDGIGSRAKRIHARDPGRKIWHSDARSHEAHKRAVRDRACRDAITEVLERKLALKFFVTMPSVVEDYNVYTAIGLPPDYIAQVPSLTRTSEDLWITRSLLEGALASIRKAVTRALFEPDPGASFGASIGASDVARDAGESLTSSAAYLADSGMPANGLFDALNELSTTAYEKRAGFGRLVIAQPDSPDIDRQLEFQERVPVREIRTLRKLLEISGRSGSGVLIDGREAYGLGSISPTYDTASESVFEVIVSGPGTWDLRHAGTPLMAVTYGSPHFPARRLSRERFDDTAHRLFGPSGCDTARLWELAIAASQAEHGTMLVVSGNAGDEAERLKGQALMVVPSAIGPEIVRQVSRIDGALLVDPVGALAAIGVILDGTATLEGDRSRGARYNSAIRYLASTAAKTMIVLVSEDGMLDLLPRLRPLLKRADRDRLMQELRDAAAVEPVSGERFFKAYRRVEAAAFYLTDEQCTEANALRKEHWERRRAAGATLWIEDSDLAPHPEMSDEYLVE